MEQRRWEKAVEVLTLRYAIEHANQPAQALRLAEREAARRQDVYTVEVCLNRAA